ncbi:MAG: hypothetical protein GQ532_17130 [Methylomarinum sp.]|nr:hypothetical protein [Methylomarinum sp.]
MKKELALIVGLATASMFNTVLAEVISGTNLSVNFESGHIIGSGRNINMQRIPVINIDTGETVFYDASFKFTFSPSTGLTFEQISSAAISPPLSSSNLIPGVYQGDVGAAQYTLSEPSILSDGRLFYTLSRSNTTGGFNAQIVTGSAENHPDIGARDITTNLSPTYTYGVIASAASTGDGNSSFRPFNEKWLENQLIGIRQTGETLSVILFSEGVDSNNEPQDFSTQRAGAVLTKIFE